MRRQDVEADIKGCNVFLASKAVWHKLSRNLQALQVLTHRWKDLCVDFVTGLLLSIDWKGKSYDSILVIVDRLTKMVHYELMKITINILGLAEVFINVVIWHHGLLDSIITDQSSLFTSKFRSSLCYFLEIKRKLFTTFHPQTNSQNRDKRAQ